MSPSSELRLRLVGAINRIAQTRGYLPGTMGELADKAGIPRRTMRDILAERRDISGPRLADLASALGVTVAQVLAQAAAVDVLPYTTASGCILARWDTQLGRLVPFGPV